MADGPATAGGCLVNSAEVQLLLCCARPVIDGATAARIRPLIEAGPDWTRLIELALRHGVTALLHRALSTACPDAVPRELIEALREHVSSSGERVRLLADELSGIVADCRRRDVPVIPFKGPTLAAAAYGDIALRSPGDLDLMVRESDLPAMHEVLAARGFRRIDGPEQPLPDHLEAAYRKYQCEQIFLRQSDMVVVEPQWAIGARTLAYAIDYDALWRRARRTQFNGAEVLAFAHEDLLLLLCVHGAKHTWSQLRWIADIAALLARQAAIDLESCLMDGRRQGCERTVLLGLALAEELLGVALPQPVRGRIAADAACADLVRKTVAMLFRDSHEPPGPFAVTRYRLRSRERLRDRILCVLRCVLTPRVTHFSIVRLPPVLSFLYCPIKLAHDYMLLPAWLAFKAIRSRCAGG